MPAGDLVVADWQVELRTTLMGATTIYGIAPDRLAGFGVPAMKTADLDLLDADGSYGGRDRLGPRVISVPLEIATGSATSAVDGLEVMNTVWAPSITDLPLYFRIPGFGKRWVNGRPRGLTDDLRYVEFGVVYCLATFVALDPTIYGP